jgi:hypothetical protein
MTSTAHFLHKDLTAKDALDPAMTITDRADADRYLTAYAEWLVNFYDLPVESAYKRARHILGYYAGYYDHETRDRVYAMFDAPHPIFGTHHPTPDEAFTAGQRLGEQLRRAGDPT